MRRFEELASQLDDINGLLQHTIRMYRCDALKLFGYARGRYEYDGDVGVHAPKASGYIYAIRVVCQIHVGEQHIRWWVCKYMPRLGGGRRCPKDVIADVLADAL